MPSPPLPPHMRRKRIRQRRGAIRADLDRLRRRINSKTERIKTLRVLADECWAEGEPSIGRDTLDSLEVGAVDETCRRRRISVTSVVLALVT